jgi:transcriptional regulator with XRE-family HTH domain
MARDFVAELISERSKKNPQFPELVAEAERRLAFARRLAARREKLGLSQTVVAAKMRTAASVVSKLEAGGDVKLSTLQRYFAAIGQTSPSSLRSGHAVLQALHAHRELRLACSSDAACAVHRSLRRPPR